MAASLKAFRQNFPGASGAIHTMEIITSAKKGDMRSVRETIEEEIPDTFLPDQSRTKGIFLHQLNDVFEADYHLDQALEHYPNDVDLLCAMATNRFQIGRLASARSYAQRAIALDPSKRRMVFLSRVSWLFYYPGAYLFLLMLSAGHLLRAHANKYVAIAGFLLGIYILADSLNLLFSPLLILFGIGSVRAGTVMIALLLACYFLAISQQHYDMLFGRSKPVKLKKY